MVYQHYVYILQVIYVQYIIVCFEREAENCYPQLGKTANVLNYLN